MIALTRRMASSRPWRKFRRSRLALAAAAVIALYALVALACVGGLINEHDTQVRVGPDTIPGFDSSQTPEKRLRDCKFWREQLARVLQREDPAKELHDLAFAERRPADINLTDLTALVRHANALADDLAGTLDHVDSARVRLDQADREGKPAALPDADEQEFEPGASQIMTRPELAIAEARLNTKLGQLETVIATLWPRPAGADGVRYTLRTCLGTDRQGRSISVRAVYSIRIALQVGLIVALISVGVGALLGAAAAYYGGVVDHAVTWLYSTFSSIPELVLLGLIAYVFTNLTVGDELIPVYAALSLTFWIGPCRVVRGEVMKIKELEYVQAVRAIGFGRWYILRKHIIPNTIHLMFINFSLLFIAAVKAEVILTFLGLGVKDGASWGLMIGQARTEVSNGFFWQIGAATAFMFVLVLAFNIFADALQDAFDPKHVG